MTATITIRILPHPSGVPVAVRTIPGPHPGTVTFVASTNSMQALTELRLMQETHDAALARLPPKTPSCCEWLKAKLCCCFSKKQNDEGIIYAVAQNRIAPPARTRRPIVAPAPPPPLAIPPVQARPPAQLSPSHMVNGVLIPHLQLSQIPR